MTATTYSDDLPFSSRLGQAAPVCPTASADDMHYHPGLSTAS